MQLCPSSSNPSCRHKEYYYIFSRSTPRSAATTSNGGIIVQKQQKAVAKIARDGFKHAIRGVDAIYTASPLKSG
jgi:hypothetical protein